MRRDHDPQDDLEHPAPTAVELPLEFRARVEALLGQETEPFLRSLVSPPLGLRVNTLRLTPQRFREITPFRLVPLRFPEAGFLVTEGPRPGKHPYHAAGLYYLQDPGAMVVGALVNPQPGERVLDLAAAPGGKATHLASLLRGTGVLVANDVSPSRARELAGNLERFGARNAVVLSEPADRLADHFGAWFDRVLLDAPCSGESMFHKSAAARDDWSPAAVLGCARRQSELIVDAARLVRPGGLLVYSTCTFAPEENEGVIAGFLAANPGWEVAELEPVPGATHGNPDWLPPEMRRPDLRRTLRLWPHRSSGAGHFVAALRRTGGEEEFPAPAPASDVPAEARRLLEEFRHEHLRVDFDPGLLALRGPELYQLPAGLPSLGRLRAPRPGWWLGSVLKKRFEPAHALALGLASDEVEATLDLDPDGPEVFAYLRGESLSIPGPAGWVLVTVRGFPLGWGKRVGSTVKNHYPKGLRWR